MKNHKETKTLIEEELMKDNLKISSFFFSSEMKHSDEENHIN